MPVSLSQIVGNMIDAGASKEAIMAVIEAAVPQKTVRQLQNERAYARRKLLKPAEFQQVLKPAENLLKPAEFQTPSRVEDNLLKLEIAGKKKEKEESVVSRKRATRLTEDWKIPDEWLQEAVQAGMSLQQAANEAERMKNWSMGSKNGVKLDWRATWRNWFKDKILNTPTQKPFGTTNGRRGIVDAFFDSETRRTADEQRSESRNSGNVELFPTGRRVEPRLVVGDVLDGAGWLRG